MKIKKDLEPIVSGISAAIVISILAFFTLETSAGVWLMFSFGATVFIVFVPVSYTHLTLPTKRIV